MIFWNMNWCELYYATRTRGRSQYVTLQCRSGEACDQCSLDKFCQLYVLSLGSGRISCTFFHVLEGAMAWILKNMTIVVCTMRGSNVVGALRLGPIDQMNPDEHIYYTFRDAMYNMCSRSTKIKGQYYRKQPCRGYVLPECCIFYRICVILSRPLQLQCKVRLLSCRLSSLSMSAFCDKTTEATITWFWLKSISVP